MLSSTDYLAHYNLPMKEFGTEICGALLAHATTLETVHIGRKVSNNHFLNAGRILGSCPQSHVLYLLQQQQDRLSREEFGPLPTRLGLLKPPGA